MVEHGSKMSAGSVTTPSSLSNCGLLGEGHLVVPASGPIRGERPTPPFRLKSKLQFPIRNGATSGCCSRSTPFPRCSSWARTAQRFFAQDRLLVFLRIACVAARSWLTGNTVWTPPLASTQDLQAPPLQPLKPGVPQLTGLKAPRQHHPLTL